MADQDKGKFSADIGQDVIEEALRSVQRRKAGEGEAAEASVPLDVEAPATEAEVPTELAGAAEAPAEPPALTAEQQELETLRAQLEFSQAKGRELMEKVKEEHERVLRATADLDNFRKRALKDKEDIQRFGVEKLLKDFLPVVDNLDRALEHASSPADFESLVTGIRMTKKLFEDALGKHGVRGFVSKGKPFDPRFHEAMQQVETEELPPNHVHLEVLRGFMIHDRLARPALVMVTKAPEKAAEAAPEQVAEQNAAQPVEAQSSASGEGSGGGDEGPGGGTAAS